MRLSRGTARMFQRARSATGPWRRLPDQADLFNNAYCITVSTGQTVFGGFRTAEFVTPPTSTFRLSPKTPACPGSRPASTSTFKSLTPASPSSSRCSGASSPGHPQPDPGPHRGLNPPAAACPWAGGGANWRTPAFAGTTNATLRTTNSALHELRQPKSAAPTQNGGGPVRQRLGVSLALRIKHRPLVTIEASGGWVMCAIQAGGMARPDSVERRMQGRPGHPRPWPDVLRLLQEFCGYLQNPAMKQRAYRA